MREFINRHPMVAYGIGFFVMLTVTPLVTRGLPGGFWVLLVVVPFLPAAFRGLQQDAKRIVWWTRSRTARVKVTDDALQSFLAEREDERH